MQQILSSGLEVTQDVPKSAIGCAGICLKYAPSRPEGVHGNVSFYDFGHKRCLKCQRFIDKDKWTGAQCPCCKQTRLRGGPKNKDKKKHERNIRRIG